jgi:import receptor subunit TOM70
MSSPSSRVPVPDSTLVERVQTFVSENRRAVLLGAAAVVAAGGAAYYAASSSRSKARVQDAERADKKKKRKSQARDKDGPIIEERSPEEDGQRTAAFELGCIR